MVVAVCAALGAAGVAEAGRKRVVVLEFEGPRGDKFHGELVRLIKKSHTVVSTEKWNGAAEQLDAGAISDRNIKKVARKLKVDAVVEGRIEKRRDDFILRLRLRAGKTGELIGETISTKSTGARIEGRAQRELKDELIAAIDGVEPNRTGGDDAEPAGKDDDAERPARKPRPAADEDTEDRPARKGFARRDDDERGIDRTDRTERRAKKPARDEADEDDAAPAKKPARSGDDKLLATRKPETRKPVAGGDDDPAVATRPGKRPVAEADASPDAETDPAERRGGPARRVAARDDDAEASVERDRPARLDAQTALSHGERALDAVAGLSVTMRRFAFAAANTATPPRGYDGTPVAGAMFDVTAYPLAFGHTRTDQLRNLGFQVLYDRVITLSSKDPTTGTSYSTIESRYWLAAVFRHAFGSAPTAPVVIGSLGYGGQMFNILGNIGLPDVKYSVVAPGAALRYPASPKLTIDVDAKLLVPLSVGQISDPNYYGTATVLGFDGSAGVDYQITPNIFARGNLRFETFGYTFKGGGALSTGVAGARDNYFGGAVTVGYLY